MPRPSRQFARAILVSLMLIVGSVQAQVSYFCEMMDTVIHDDCCCVDADFDEMMVHDSGPCCEKSIDLVVDASTDQAQPPAKPVKFDSDVDPPDILFAVIEIQLPRTGAAIACGVGQPGAYRQAGNAIWLTTQRLRL
jgi:hypothetical protein